MKCVFRVGVLTHGGKGHDNPTFQPYIELMAGIIGAIVNGELLEEAEFVTIREWGPDGLRF